MAWVAAILAMLVLVVVFVAPKGIKDRLYFGSTLVATPTSWIMGYYCVDAVFALGHSLDARFFLRTPASTRFMHVYIAANICNLLVELLGDKKFAKKIPMIGHHLLSIVAYGAALRTGRMHFYACLDGLCEVTNTFLNPMLLSRTEGGTFAASYKGRVF